MTAEVAIPGTGEVEAEVVDAGIVEVQPACRGHVIIEWPRPPRNSLWPQPIPGFAILVLDGLSRKPILTVSRVEVHAEASGLVTADLTLWAGPDGEPLTDTSVMYRRGDEIVTGTFRYLVSEMAVRESDDPKAVHERIKASGVHWRIGKVIEVP
jgi:hypothetical protein